MSSDSEDEAQFRGFYGKALEPYDEGMKTYQILIYKQAN